MEFNRAPRTVSFTTHLLTSKGYLAGNETLEFSSGSFTSVAHGARFGIWLGQDSVEGHQDALSFWASMSVKAFDLEKKILSAGLEPWTEMSFSHGAGIEAPPYQSIGWLEEAQSFLDYIWTVYRERRPELAEVLFGNPEPRSWVNEHANPYFAKKPAWFTTMTTLDPDQWRSHGYDPDPDSLGPYWMLAQIWDDPDPCKVRNALQAVRDMNLGTTFIKDEPMRKRAYIVDEFLLLDDYDIGAVNMRRVARGLAPVEVETYLPQPLPNEVLPFAQDDIFWPAYVRMCEDIAATPIAPENKVSVRLDPETLRIERI